MRSLKKLLKQVKLMMLLTIKKVLKLTLMLKQTPARRNPLAEMNLLLAKSLPEKKNLLMKRMKVHPKKIC